ncbi:hypothetical protein CHS0354_040221 [Potamilus streckersoni]|uniref:UmuC domain-containing protein n=1 Tax=Potamilus streckersoni TaxID=2493646 RepID=A0AAE0S4K8_9BIVA|nr:hypothetical protein CHS0354_040221 [Potamilus streckersoni]
MDSSDEFNSPEYGSDIDVEDEDWGKPTSCSYSDGQIQIPVTSTHALQQCNESRSIKTASSDRGSAGIEHPRTILHIDIDCFYAQVEMIRNPELKDKPLGIQQKYLMVTCNYKARELGVTKMMSVKDAKEKCPNLVLVSGEDLTHYRQMSYQISEFLTRYSSEVERLGFDENFIDITDMVQQRIHLGNYIPEIKGHIYGRDDFSVSKDLSPESCICGCHTRLAVGSQIADDIRDSLFQELGITCCGGISYNKLLSKLVAGTHKPNQQTTLFPEQTQELLKSLKHVRQIPGVGWNTCKILEAMGITTVRDVQSALLENLEKELGKPLAVTVKKLCDGIDDTPVHPYGLPQTMSDEDSFRKLSSVSEAKEKIRELLHSLLKRLLEDGRVPRTFRLTVRKFQTGMNKYTCRESRQCPVVPSVFFGFSSDTLNQVCNQMEKIAMNLFTKLVDTNQPFHLTLINVAFAKLEQKSKISIANYFSPTNQKRKEFEEKDEEPNAKRDRLDTDGDDHIRISQEKKPAGLLKWFRTNFTSKDIGNNNTKVLDTVGDGGDIHRSQKSVVDNKPQLHQFNKTRLSASCFKNYQTTGVASLEKVFEGTSVQSMKNNGLQTGSDKHSYTINLPREVDQSVFSELPASIQQELIQSFSKETQTGQIKCNGKNGILQQTSPASEITYAYKRQTLSGKSNPSSNCRVTGISRKIIDSRTFINNKLDQGFTEQNTLHSYSSSSVQETLKNEQTDCTIQSCNEIEGVTHIEKQLVTVCNCLHSCVQVEQQISLIDACTHNNQSLHNLYSSTGESDQNNCGKQSGMVKCSEENAFGGDNKYLKQTICIEDDPPGETQKPQLRISPEKHLEIPLDVDKEIFLSLPPDIQKEIIQDWKIRSESHAIKIDVNANSTNGKMSKSTKASKGILSYFSNAE